MYYPEIDVDIRLNAPKVHQRIISKLTASLGHLFYHEHEISLESLPETQIDEGQASLVPDILLYDNEIHEMLIIENYYLNGLNNDMRKIIRLIEENDYDTEEGFIYDYVRGIWSNYKKERVKYLIISRV